MGYMPIPTPRKPKRLTPLPPAPPSNYRQGAPRTRLYLHEAPPARWRWTLWRRVKLWWNFRTRRIAAIKRGEALERLRYYRNQLPRGLTSPRLNELARHASFAGVSAEEVEKAMFDKMDAALDELDDMRQKPQPLIQPFNGEPKRKPKPTPLPPPPKRIWM